MRLQREEKREVKEIDFNLLVICYHLVRRRNKWKDSFKAQNNELDC